MTEPELAAVSGAGGESRGFEGRSRAQAAGAQLSQLSRQQLLRPSCDTGRWAVSKASLPPGQPIDVRWTLAVD